MFTFQWSWCWSQPCRCLLWLVNFVNCNGVNQCPPQAFSKLRVSTTHGCKTYSFAALALLHECPHNLQNLVVCKVLYGVGICWERLWASGYLIISSFANWKPTSINSNPNLNWTGQWDDKGGRKTSKKNRQTSHQNSNYVGKLWAELCPSIFGSPSNTT